jgi:hypothetical protein
MLLFFYVQLVTEKKVFEGYVIAHQSFNDYALQTSCDYFVRIFQSYAILLTKSVYIAKRDTL